MNKKKFLEIIDRGIIKEEMAVPVLLEHLQTALNWKNLSDNKKEIINKYINIIINDTKKHALALKNIKNQITKD